MRVIDMTELVHDHVVNDRHRRHSQAPAQADGPIAGAASPAPLLISNENRLRLNPHDPSKFSSPLIEYSLGLQHEPAHRQPLHQTLGLTGRRWNSSLEQLSLLAHLASTAL